jgi:hypothetical protein
MGAQNNINVSNKASNTLAEEKSDFHTQGTAYNTLTEWL